MRFVTLSSTRTPFEGIFTMRGFSFDAIHMAVSAACMRDLPDVQYWDRSWDRYREVTDSKEYKDADAKQKVALIDNDPNMRIAKRRRPDLYDIEVWVFDQSWGDTSLGYGGPAGQAVTTASTIVVKHHSTYCVYFGGGRLAYSIDIGVSSPEGRAKIMEDLHDFNMAGIWDVGRYR